MTARAWHFSVYAALQSSLTVERELVRNSANSSCPGDLIGRMKPVSPLTDLDALSINNLSEELRTLSEEESLSVQDLLMRPDFEGR